MDPVSIIGLAGSVIGIIDVISKNISFLRNLQSKYRQADFTVSLLCGQLSTLKAALNQISQWIDSESKNPQQRQLVEDLTISLQGCKVLILFLDTRLDELHKDESTKNLTSRGKITFVLEDSEVKEYLNHLNNQINALNLLLTAIQCRSIFDQRNLLSGRDSRHIMKLAKDDTSSLLMVGGDAESFCTKRSALNLESRFLDIIFDFDREIFNSKPYRGALRSNMVQILSRDKPGPSLLRKSGHPCPGGDANRDSDIPTGSTESATCTIDRGPISNTTEAQHPSASTAKNDALVSGQIADVHSRRMPIGKLSAGANDQRSSLEKNGRQKSKAWFQIGLRKRLSSASLRHEEVERMLSVFEAQARRERKILVLGPGQSGKTTLVKSFRLWQNASTFTSAEFEEWKPIIVSNLIQTARAIVEAMEDLNLPYESFERNERAILMEDQPIFQYEVTTSKLNALEKLWKDAAVQKAYKESSECVRRSCFEGNEAYFFNSLQRILHTHYIPSVSDIFWARVRTTGITETIFEVEDKIYRIFDLGGARSERKKWIHTYYDAEVLVFTADLGGHSEALIEDKDADCMLESLMLFESLVNSQWFTKTHIILQLTKVDKLSQTLITTPLDQTFPEYSGGEDFEAAKSYITEKFVSLAPKHHRPLCVNYTSFVGDETSLARVVSKSIEHLEDRGNIESERAADYFVMWEYGVPEYHSLR